MDDTHGCWLFECVLNVHSVWFLIEVLALIANLFLEILFFFNFPVERSMDVYNSFIKILVSHLVLLGAGAAIEMLEKWLVDGAGSENLHSIKILIYRCGDALEEWLLQPLLDYLEERREMMQAEELSEREKRDARRRAEAESVWTMKREMQKWKWPAGRRAAMLGRRLELQMRG